MDEVSDYKKLRCKKCGGSMERVYNVPGIGEFSGKSKQEKISSLKKRAKEHAKKNLEEKIYKHKTTNP